VSDVDLDQRLARLAQASEGIRARPGFVEQATLAALAAGAPGLSADPSRPLRRAVPLAALAAVLSVLWAVISEQGTDDVFAAADESVEIEW